MSCCGSSKKDKGKEKDGITQQSPLDQLKIKLVNGEINMDEYLQKKEVIAQP